MAEKREIIIEVEVDNEKAIKRTEDLKRKMEAQKVAINDTKKAIKALDQESATYADDLKRLSAEQLNQENALKRTTKEFNLHNKAAQANANSIEALEAQNARFTDALKRVDQSTERGQKLFNDLTNAIAANKDKIKEATAAAKGSVSAYDALQAKLTAAKNEYKDLAAAQASGNKLTKEQIARMNALQKEIKETDAALKEIDATMGQFQRNVGDYRNAIDEAIQSNQGLMGSFGGAGDGADGMAAQLQQLGRALMGLAANPIGAVIAVLATLVAAFSQTAGGATMFKDIMGGLGQMFNKVTGDIGKVAQSILDFGSLIIKDPVKALETVGDAIKTNLINRVQGALNLFPAIGKVIKEALSGNFEEAGAAAKEAADAFIQFQTGIEGATDAVADYGKELGDAYQQGVKYTEMQRAIDQQNRALIISQAKLTGALEMTRATLNDDTLGWNERRKAGEEAMKNAEKLAAVEMRLAQNQLASINNQIAARAKESLSVTEFADQQAQALANVITARNNYNMTMRDLDEERRKMSRDQMESQLDVLVDVADTQRAVAERQIADARVDAEARKQLLADLQAAENLSTTERIAMLNKFDARSKQSMEERKALSDESMQDYRQSSESFIELIEKQEKKDIDYTALLEEKSTERRLQMMKELDLSEISQTRLNEIVRERLSKESEYIAEKNALLDEEIATEKSKREKQVADDAALMQLRAENEVIGFENRMAALDSQMAAELVKYEGNEAMKAEITKKYDKQKMELKKTQQEAELAMTSQMLGEAAALFEENTIAYKVLATGQAIMNTYMAATAALASGSKLSPIYGQIAAGIAIATGLASVAKINGVKFADGGLLKGKSHDQGGIPFAVGGAVGFEAEGGEFITNKRSTARNFDAIATINANPSVNFAAVPFAMGGAISTGAANARNESSMIQYNAMKSQPIVVTVEDIRRAENRVSVAERRTSW